MDPWEASTRSAYAAEIGLVRQILEQVVRENPGDGNTSYGTLLRQIPTLPQDLNKWHPLWQILGCVSIDTHHERLGMLSVIVWNKENQPGKPGFYDVARDYCGWSSSASDDEIFSGEFRRVHEAYHRS